MTEARDSRAFDVVGPQPEPRERMDIPHDWTFHDDGVAKHFDEHVRESLPWYDMATGAIAHIARHYIPEGGQVYDLGASTGNITEALLPAAESRAASICAVEASPQMFKAYVARGFDTNAVHADVREFEFQPCDLIVAFLLLMFVPPADRAALVHRMTQALRPGGALITMDKFEGPGGYVGTVMHRLTLAGKVAAGVPAQEVVDKEMSLGGALRPLEDRCPVSAVSRSNDGLSAYEWIRFGEFSGWLITRGY